ncbi:MAG TPA: IPT/TIG domain-containing protein [Terriglobia bacterium]|nr:IPT/TIG domain-containing protein [Terriglobia bacterium]
MACRLEDVGFVCNSTVATVGAQRGRVERTRIRNNRWVIWIRLAIALIVYASVAPQSYAAAPSISSLTPNSGAVGTQVKLAGSNFGQTQGSSKVTFNGVVATVNAWNKNSITAIVPAASTTGPVVVTVGGVASNSVTFVVISNIPEPKISYTYDAVGRLLSAGDAQSGKTAAYTYDSAGNILSVAQYASTTVSVISFSPATGSVGASVTIYGTGFSTTPSQNSVSFNGANATVSSSTATQIVATVPIGATTGPIGVTVNGKSASSTNPFTIGQPPTITGFTPSVADPRTAVSVSGDNFQPITVLNEVKVNSFPSQVQSSTPTNLATPSPAVGSGRISVTTPFGTAISNDDLYIAPSPYTASLVSPVGTGSGRISVGTPTTASVGLGQVGLLLFDGTAGQKISASLSNGTFPTCSADFLLLSPAATRLAASQCIGAEGFIDATVLPATGTYSLELGSVRGAGNATINAYDAMDLTAPITVGGQAILTNTVPGQNLRFTFTLSQPTKVSAGLFLFDGGSYTHCADASILNSTGVIVAHYNNFPTFRCEDRTFVDAVTLPAGSYALLADPEGSFVNLNVTARLYNAADLTGSVNINRRAVTFTTAGNGQNLAVRFNGSAGQLVTIRLTDAFIYAEQQCMSVTLFSTNGTTALVSQTVCNVYNTDSVLPQVSLPNTGTYTIYIDPVWAGAEMVTVAVTSP